MFNIIGLSKKTLATFMGLLFVSQPISVKITDILPIDTKKINAADFKSWKRIHSVEGKCSCTFPKVPEHIQQKMPMKGGQNDLQYYVYVADHERKEVFMVLVAKYPGVVDNESAVKNLEHFLNTLLAQNPSNRLLFADLISVQGFTGMDFFIRTEQVYFKGRAIQANNSLYLLAMECEIPNYTEEHYNFFIESFELHK